MIKLTIEKEITNENFEKEMEEYNQNNRRNGMYNNNRYDGPRPTKIENALQVTITEEQWVAIRKAVIEQF